MSFTENFSEINDRMGGALPMMLVFSAMGAVFSSCATAPPPSAAVMVPAGKQVGLVAMVDPGYRRGSVIPDQDQLTAKMYGASATSLGSAPVGKPVPGAKDFVFSPFTSTPKLVDVHRFSPGDEATCPYTMRAFVVPNFDRVAIASHGAPLRYEPKRSVAVPERTSVARTASNPKPRPSVAPDVPTVVQGPVKEVRTKPKPLPDPVTESEDELEALTPDATSPNPNPLPSDATVAEWVPGRPGFVRSPFGKDYQYVDVTGIPAGTEVKCPYTGKLFRVPPPQ